MRLNLLTIENIGPFKGRHSIDFSTKDLDKPIILIFLPYILAINFNKLNLEIFVEDKLYKPLIFLFFKIYFSKKSNISIVGRPLK